MIHGVFYKTSKFIAQRSFIENNRNDLLLDPLRQNLVTVSTPQYWLAQEIDKKAPQSLSRDGDPSRTIMTAWARLDNHEELADRLGLTQPDRNTLSDAQLILRAYLQFGEACTEYLFGDFSFAIYDSTHHHFFCVRDQMGIKPFYYYDDPDIFVFSASMAFFHRMPGLSIQPSLAWASRFLLDYSACMDFEKTPYTQLLKLPPAHQLKISKNERTKTRYFSFHTNKIHFNTSADYVGYYQSHLDNAIKCRVQVAHPLGSELSGGLDSSTVTAYAVKHYPGTLDNFHTFGFANFSDEPKHLLSVNQHLNIPMGYVCCNPSLFAADPMRALTALGAPVQHGNTTAHEIFYHMMAKNMDVRTLLSGFGGDEFVTTLHGYLVLYEFMKNKQYLKLYQHLTGNTLTRALRVLKYSYHHLRHPGVQHTFMADAYAQRWPLQVIADELIHTYDLKTLYDNAGKFDHGYDDLDQFTLENRLAPFISTRTEEGSLMAATYGIDYRWPLLDTRLIQCFLSMPSEEKYYRGIGRYLHKRAVKDMLPANITAQPSKYMGPRITPSYLFSESLNDDLHPNVLPLINEPKLRAQQKKLTSEAKPNEVERLAIGLNITRTNQLDNWLKHYFAKGFTWDTDHHETA